MSEKREFKLPQEITAITPLKAPPFEELQKPRERGRHAALRLDPVIVDHIRALARSQNESPEDLANRILRKHLEAQGQTFSIIPFGAFD